MAPGQKGHSTAISQDKEEIWDNAQKAWSGNKNTEVLKNHLKIWVKISRKLTSSVPRTQLMFEFVPVAWLYRLYNCVFLT